jgi:hypothetical protein
LESDALLSLTASIADEFFMCFGGLRPAIPFRFWWRNILSDFRPEPAHEINEEANHEYQANSAATDGRTSEVKSTPANQQQQDQQNDQ